MKKVLFIANSDRHMILCHIPYMKMYHRNGYTVHVATNTSKEIEACDKKINLKLKRNPYSLKNISAIFRTRKLIKKENYDIVTCHTPVGSFLARTATIGMKKKPLIIYIAHGFHFYKKGPILNWIIIYPIEKFLSHFTDAIITMNEEDYELAKKKFHCKVFKINGIGLDEKRLQTNEKQLKKKLNLKNKYVITYIAEISKRKNQLEFLKKLKKYPMDRNIEFLFVGDSNIKNFDKKIKGLKNVKHIDFTNNVADYITISDLIISPSKQEGLPQNILEAMYYNKMIIATDIRGTNELINSENGILVQNIDEMLKKIMEVKHTTLKSIHNNIEKYKIENVMVQYEDIINEFLIEKLVD